MDVLKHTKDLNGVSQVRACKIDKNQPEIVKHARLLGAQVAITSMVGSGFPDLVIAFK